MMGMKWKTCKQNEHFIKSKGFLCVNNELVVLSKCLCDSSTLITSMRKQDLEKIKNKSRHEMLLFDIKIISKCYDPAADVMG